jgi:hypothetical protein
MRAIAVVLGLALSTAAWAECKLPTSSWISMLCFDSGRVTATMSGNDYTFCGVPRSVFDAWASASSAGGYYHDHVKGRYQCF